MEAMATGLPVVAADGGALPELVKNGENGFLFSPYDANALSQALVKILKDENLRKNMSKKSLEIIAFHDQKIVFQKLKDFYNEVFQD
jgi:glycosyltransferase involved in cell wall biosynthesis